MIHTLNGKRVLVTQADAFMGPMLCDVLAEHGAEVVRSIASLLEPDAASAIVQSAGAIDVLVANLAYAAPTTLATEATDTEWAALSRPWLTPCHASSEPSCRR